MTGRWEDGTVRVRRLTTGVLRVGPYSISAAGVARLNLPGSTMLVDPTTPHCIPGLEVSEVSEAVEVVRALYGSTVADHVLDPEQHAQEAVDIEWVPGPELRDLSHLGHLIWLACSAPWPMPSTVLVAELIVAIDSCLVMLEGSDEASLAIAGYAGPMLAALPAAVSGHAPSAVVRRLVDASRAIIRHLPVTDAARPQLMAAIERVTASSRDSEGRAFVSEALLDACTPAAAPHAGTADEGVLYTGSATAEWSRNTGGFVSRDEGSITWTVQTDPADGALVTVVATRGLPEPLVGDTGLPPMSPAVLIRAVSDAGWATGRAAACSIHTPAWPLPLLEVLLSPHPDTGDLTASATVRGPGADALAAALRQGTLVVDVHDLGMHHAPLVGVDPAVEAARRWTGRALCASRVALAWPDDTVAMAARGAWTRALALWRRTGPRTLAQERARHCAAWLALVTADGDPGEPSSPTLPDLGDVITGTDAGAVGERITLSEVLAAGPVANR